MYRDGSFTGINFWENGRAWIGEKASWIHFFEVFCYKKRKEKEKDEVIASMYSGILHALCIYSFILGKGNYSMFTAYKNLEGKGENWWNYVLE